MAFRSISDNFIPEDNNGFDDIFLRDIQTGLTSRVSVSSAGTETDAESRSPAISADGRYVIFRSYATNLVPDDTNGTWDVFVRDTTDMITSRVSVSTAGTEADDQSSYPVVNSDGRYVAFESSATNLVPDDGNGVTDVFLHDTTGAITSGVSVSTAGTEADGQSRYPSISADGRYVIFRSYATNLVPDDTNGTWDVFVRDTTDMITSRVSVSTAGTEADDQSSYPVVNSDGRYVAFESSATNLVPDDGNSVTDVFLHDTIGAITSRVSVSTAGTEADGQSRYPSISADGRYIVFQSDAANLVPEDNNGVTDIFVHDAVYGVTARVSLTQSGGEGDGPSTDPAITSDGQYVIFLSDATNLIDGRVISTRQVYRAKRP